MQSGKHPLVSIVTPSFNSAKTIRETIESVLEQDYPAIEHIVVDGNSTDGTQEILGSYPHLKWISEPDNGQSQAINKGFRLCNGEIIGWLNADDTYTEGAAADAVKILLSHPEIDLIYTNCNVIDESGNFIKIAKSGPYRLDEQLFVNYVKQPTVFMRKSMLQKIGDLDERLHFVMDWEFWLRAHLSSCQMLFLPDKIYANFRWAPGTKSYEQPRKFLEEWKTVLEKPDIVDNDLVDKDVLFFARRKNLCQLHFSAFVDELYRKKLDITIFKYLIYAFQADYGLALILSMRLLQKSFIKS